MDVESKSPGTKVPSVTRELIPVLPCPGKKVFAGKTILFHVTIVLFPSNLSESKLWQSRELWLVI